MLQADSSAGGCITPGLSTSYIRPFLIPLTYGPPWKEIEILDEDLGYTASGVEARAGFERMVVEVSLGKVGAVAAREVSRFARNSRDWQQLIEVCRIVDTLLIDHETVYNPRQGNDRLLLGLKGSLNEYELGVATFWQRVFATCWTYRDASDLRQHGSANSPRSRLTSRLPATGASPRPWAVSSACLNAPSCP